MTLPQHFRPGNILQCTHGMATQHHEPCLALPGQVPTSDGIIVRRQVGQGGWGLAELGWGQGGRDVPCRMESRQWSDIPCWAFTICLCNLPENDN